MTAPATLRRRSSAPRQTNEVSAGSRRTDVGPALKSVSGKVEVGSRANAGKSLQADKPCVRCPLTRWRLPSRGLSRNPDVRLAMPREYLVAFGTNR